jgi:5-(carboxyamino)imidazole ribonucleotide mutase
MKVAVLLGSKHDADKMAGAKDMLERFGIECEVWAMSAHRNAEVVREFVGSARENGFGVIIAAAGMAAHLAGACAANTTLPVIGVPISGSKLDGLDSLLSTVQMPPGMPVATVAIDGAANAGLLAVEMLSITDDVLAKKLAEYRESWQPERLA